MVLTIKLLLLTKLNKLSDQRVTSNNTGTGHIKRLQINGTLTEPVPQTTLPTVELKFNQRLLLDGTLLLPFCNNKLELDGLNSLDAFLMIQMFLLRLMFQTLLKPTASGAPLHRDQAFLEIVWTF